MALSGERIKSAIEYLRSVGRVHTQKDVAQKMGTTPPNVSSAIKGTESVLTESFIHRFNRAFDYIFNDAWLLTGEGDMLNSNNNEANQPQISYTKGVPYYNVDFIGGFDLILNDQTVNPEYLIDFKKYNEATCWCNVTGHSMEPEITHGDIIALKKIEDISFLPFGEVYAIVTTNDMRTIKRIGPASDASCYSLIPTNKSPEYGIQELPRNMVRHIFHVLGCVKRL